jgi:hypothetical protein
MIELISKIIDVENINLTDSFEIAKICSEMIRKNESEGAGRKIVINILNNWEKIDPASKELWSDLIEAVGFYPYIKKEKLDILSTAGKIRTECHASNNIIKNYFHEEQKIIYDILASEKNVVLSAPTSFGKSLLIEEIVSSKKYKNIVVIQPTLALLDETRRKLKKYDNFYKLIVRTSQKPSEKKGNLFLFTSERVMEYEDFPVIDFMVIDEFYKLSNKRDDERADVLNNAFYKLYKNFDCKFYFLGPNIDNISENFSATYNAEFYRTNYSLVETNTNNYYEKYKNQFGIQGEKKKFKEQKLFELLFSLKNEQSIIYCSSPERARYLAKEFHFFLSENKEAPLEENYFPLIDWIKINIAESWSLIDCLKLKIGIHDGALQKHINTSIIDYFNQGSLNFLFCTSTIIEGVNTSAKNVIFFDKTKGKQKPIDYFDFNNIKGRAGRLMVHYIGTIYNFNEEPKKQDIIVDIPVFEQNPISNEVLIHLDEAEVKNKNTEQYKKLLLIPDNEKEIFKKNGVLVNGQMAILEILKKNIEKDYLYLNWNNYPSYYQLQYILDLAWNNLLKTGESTNPMTLKKLVKVTFDYGFHKQIMKLVIDNYIYNSKLPRNADKNKEEILDDAIRDSFQILKHWFQFKVPKWLVVIHNLQKYVCEINNLKPGDYTFYSKQIENEFVRENLAILLEYGIPKSAIDKISEIIPASLSEDNIIRTLKDFDFNKINTLIPYEIYKLKSNL